MHLCLASPHCNFRFAAEAPDEDGSVQAPVVEDMDTPQHVAEPDDDDEEEEDRHERAPRRQLSTDSVADTEGGGGGGGGDGGSNAEGAGGGARGGVGGPGQVTLPSLTLLPSAAPEGVTRRYFIARPRNHFKVSESLEKQVWASGQDSAPGVEAAVQSGAQVVVFFSVDKSGALQVRSPRWLGALRA
jgi:hypothetical protein